MRNAIIAIVLLALGIFLIARFAPNTFKPGTSIVKAGNDLKASEDKAKETGDLANRVTLQNAVNSFKMSESRYPSNLQELIDKKYIDRMPAGDWKYNPETGEVGE